jgi:hypothetical protein
MRLIETFHPTPHLVPKGEPPTPCIMEDGATGYRYLVVGKELLAPGVIYAAEQSGVVDIMTVAQMHEYDG